MAIPVAPLSTGLTLVQGGRTLTQRRDEAHIEAIAFMEDVHRAAIRMIDAVMGLPVPSMLVIHEANRLAYRADFAKAELLALTINPDGAA